MKTIDKIVASTRERVAREKAAGLPPLTDNGRDPFLLERALSLPCMSFICELKKSSPWGGITVEDYPYVTIAQQFVDAGADAISVLTEPAYFMGEDRHLAEIREITSLPLLRKDFIIDPFQIEQSAVLGADAILLICAILSPAQLAAFIREADMLGLSCLVEIQNEREMITALNAGARIIGVNNHNLETTLELETDKSLRLVKQMPEDVIFVSEGGIESARYIELLRKNHADAVIIGEALMRAPDKIAQLAELRC